MLNVHAMLRARSKNKQNTKKKNLHSFQRYSSSCSKIDDVTNCISTNIDHENLNISGNIGVMLNSKGNLEVNVVSERVN